MYRLEFVHQITQKLLQWIDCIGGNWENLSSLTAFWVNFSSPSHKMFHKFLTYPPSRTAMYSTLPRSLPSLPTSCFWLSLSVGRQYLRCQTSQGIKHSQGELIPRWCHASGIHSGWIQGCFINSRVLSQALSLSLNDGAPLKPTASVPLFNVMFHQPYFMCLKSVYWYMHSADASFVVRDRSSTLGEGNERPPEALLMADLFNETCVCESVCAEKLNP